MRQPLLALLLLSGCAALPPAPEHTLHSFRKVVLSDQFHAEGANFGDLNRDGAMDVVAGPFWYQGPDFRTRHEFYPGRTFDPEKYSDNFFAHLYDFDSDGWQDILIIGFPGEEATWYRNPGKGTGHWARHRVFHEVGNESPAWADLTGDGRPEIVGVSGGHFGYVEVDWSDPARPWTFRPITPKGQRGQFTHGLGVGDVNGDGRADVLEADGWWEQPASLKGEPVWKHHPADFGEGGAQMHAYDVDGDGDSDVVTSLKAHGYGLAWYEQVPGDGGSAWVRHLIMNQRPEENRYGIHFSQLHAVELVDVDGDGVKDIVTGKRRWAHGSTGDAEPNAPPVVYWFRTVRGPDGSVDFVPYLIDDASGVGVQLVSGDLNRDGLPDLVVSNKLGTFVLMHQRTPVDRATWEAAQPRPYVPTEDTGRR